MPKRSWAHVLYSLLVLQQQIKGAPKKQDGNRGAEKWILQAYRISVQGFTSPMKYRCWRQIHILHSTILQGLVLFIFQHMLKNIFLYYYITYLSMHYTSRPEQSFESSTQQSFIYIHSWAPHLHMPTFFETRSETLKSFTPLRVCVSVCLCVNLTACLGNIFDPCFNYFALPHHLECRQPCWLYSRTVSAAVTSGTALTSRDQYLQAQHGVSLTLTALATAHRSDKERRSSGKPVALDRPANPIHFVNTHTHSVLTAMKNVCTQIHPCIRHMLLIVIHSSLTVHNVFVNAYPHTFVVIYMCLKVVLHLRKHMCSKTQVYLSYRAAMSVLPSN